MIQWPRHSKIKCFNTSGVEIAKSKRSRMDLADSLMSNHYKEDPLICIIDVSTKCDGWASWNSKNVKKIEDHIRYDLEFDGYQVEVQRISAPGKTLCSKPFRWKLEISGDIAEEVVQVDQTRSAKGSRFKVARSDASIRTIQAQIEKVFGLPRGCVSLLTPDGKKCNPKTSVKKLRSRWKMTK